MTRKEKFWIYGLFQENDMRPGVKKVEGGEFTVRHPEDGWEASFYYHLEGIGKNAVYVVTLPCNGLAVYSSSLLKECKNWCRDNMDMIAEKCSSPDAIRMEKTFTEAVRQAREREEWSDE